MLNQAKNFYMAKMRLKIYAATFILKGSSSITDIISYHTLHQCTHNIPLAIIHVFPCQINFLWGHTSWFSEDIITSLNKGDITSIHLRAFFDVPPSEYSYIRCPRFLHFKYRSTMSFMKCYRHFSIFVLNDFSHSFFKDQCFLHEY